MNYALSASGHRRFHYSFADVAIFPLQLLHALVSTPVPLFLFTLTAMLFRPPDLKAFPIDRLALLLLMAFALLRVCVLRERLQTYPVTWPLLGLLLLGLWGVLTQPYSAEAWSLFAAKWAVPFIMFHIAGLTFSDDASLCSLEIFLLVVLLYLSVISVLSLLNEPGLIFPRFISDESIGIHADRARGPFLQAVANGVCLNLLGLIALDAFRRRSLRRPLALLLFVTVPLALLATRTRAVWVSAGVSVIYLAFSAGAPRLRRAAIAISLTAAVAAFAIVGYQASTGSLSDRLVDRSPVEFRTEMYLAGWAMFTEKPLLGWGNEWEIQPEIEKRVSSFHPEYYVFHNTFLELAVERGLLGLALYVWLIASLLRLHKSCRDENCGQPFLSREFTQLWPLLLGVYLLNACAVVMNYQFVNALLFTMGGILAASNERNGRLILPAPGAAA